MVDAAIACAEDRCAGRSVSVVQFHRRQHVNVVPPPSGVLVDPDGGTGLVVLGSRDPAVLGLLTDRLMRSGDAELVDLRWIVRIIGVDLEFLAVVGPTLHIRVYSPHNSDAIGSCASCPAIVQTLRPSSQRIMLETRTPAERTAAGVSGAEGRSRSAGREPMVEAFVDGVVAMQDGAREPPR